MIPASVPVYIAIDSDAGSSQWQTAEDLAGRFPDKQKGVAQLERSVRDSAGLDFENDVKPALGPEIDIVWLDLRGGGDNSRRADAAGRRERLQATRGEGERERIRARSSCTSELNGWEVMSDSRDTIDRFKTLANGQWPRAVRRSVVQPGDRRVLCRRPREGVRERQRDHGRAQGVASRGRERSLFVGQAGRPRLDRG